MVRTSYGVCLHYSWEELRLYVLLDESWRDDTVGLCGTFNGNSQDDFLSPSGMVESSPHLFGNSWKVSSSCSSSLKPQREPCDAHQEAATFSSERCDVLAQHLFSSCHAHLSPAPFLQQCRSDVCRCGTSCLCSVLAHYARQCRRYAITVDFRAHVPECAVSCPPSMVFGACVTSCGRRCSSLSVPQDCGDECEEGCVCPQDTYYNHRTHTCVHRSECPCSVQGVDYEAGEVMVTSAGVHLCVDGILESQTITDGSCPPGQIFSNCSEEDFRGQSVSCERTCESLLLNLSCPRSPEGCVSGCSCPEGLLRHGDECFHPSSCPCLWKGKEFYPGDLVSSPCQQCVCQHGTFQCVSWPCASMCSTYGDRHYRTFDGLQFDYVGTCRVHLLKSRGGNPLSISAQNINCDEGGVCRKSLLINVGRSVLAFNDDSGKLDPSSVLQENQRLLLWSAGFFTVLHLPEEDLSILWDRRTTVHIQAGPRWKGKLSGLCGNFDLKTVNEMQTPDHMDSSSPQEFGNSWTSTECVHSPDLRTPCSILPLREALAKRRCSVLLSEVFEACHPVVDVSWFYMNCVSDACGCVAAGHCECVCSSVAAYAQSCCHQGVAVDWRSPSLCPYDCEFYNKVLGKGPFKLRPFRNGSGVLAAQRAGGSVFVQTGELRPSDVVSEFMMTPGLSRARPHDSSRVSFEAAHRPNYFLFAVGERVKLAKWEESDAFWDGATFVLHRNRWIPGYNSLESHLKPGLFLVASPPHLLKYRHSDAFRKDSLFLLSGAGSSPSPVCQWRYDSCVRPCFRTCSDPSAESCSSIPQVEGCLPVCPHHTVLDERTRRCVHVEDCVHGSSPDGMTTPSERAQTTTLPIVGIQSEALPTPDGRSPSTNPAEPLSPPVWPSATQTMPTMSRTSSAPFANTALLWLTSTARAAESLWSGFSTTQAPPSATQVMPSQTSHPINPTQAPPSGTSHPIKPTQAPPSATSLPIKPTQALPSGTSPPIKPTQVSPSGTSRPIEPTQVPPSGTSPPIKPTQVPPSGTSRPIVPTQIPPSGTSRPIKPTKVPPTGTSRPIKPTQVPPSGTSRPIKPTQAPPSGTSRPIKPTQAPPSGTSRSFEPTQAPPSGTSHPIKPTQVPPSGSSHPFKPTQAPPSGTSRPIKPTQFPPPGSSHPIKPTQALPSGTSRPIKPTQVPPPGGSHPNKPTQALPSGTSHPIKPTQAPPSGTSRSFEPTQAPPSGTSHPIKPTQVPPSGSSHPFQPTQAPPSGTSRPFEPTQAPPFGTSRPIVPTQVPPPGTSRPIEPTQVPPSGISRPIKPTQAPPFGTSRPFEPTQAPPSLTSRPIKPTQVPPTGTSRPIESTQAPPSRTSHPIKPTQAPPSGTSRPIESTQATPSGTSHPIKSTQAPPSNTSHPMKPTQATPYGTSSPIKPTQAPPSVTSHPIKSTQAPPSNTSHPIKPTQATPSGTSSPIKPTQAAPSVTSHPIKPTQAPPSNFSHPIKPTQAPPSGTSRPIKPTQAPPSGISHPIKPTQVPPSDTSYPIKPTQAPPSATSCTAIITQAPPSPEMPTTVRSSELEQNTQDNLLSSDWLSEMTPAPPKASSESRTSSTSSKSPTAPPGLPITALPPPAQSSGTSTNTVSPSTTSISFAQGSFGTVEQTVPTNGPLFSSETSTSSARAPGITSAAFKATSKDGKPESTSNKPEDLTTSGSSLKIPPVGRSTSAKPLGTATSTFGTSTTVSVMGYPSSKITSPVSPATGSLPSPASEISTPSLSTNWTSDLQHPPHHGTPSTQAKVSKGSAPFNISPALRPSLLTATPPPLWSPPSGSSVRLTTMPEKVTPWLVSTTRATPPTIQTSTLPVTPQTTSAEKSTLQPLRATSAGPPLAGRSTTAPTSTFSTAVTPPEDLMSSALTPVLSDKLDHTRPGEAPEERTPPASAVRTCTPPFTQIVDECTKYICVNNQLILFNQSQSCPFNADPPNCGLLGFAVLVNGDKCCPQWDCPCRCSLFPDLNIITLDGNSVALFKAASYVVSQLPNETISVLVQECPTDSDTQNIRLNFTNLCLVSLNISTNSHQVVIDRLQRRLFINSRYAKPRFRKYGFEIYDTGNVYLIRSPAGLRLQWFHSTGMMVMESEQKIPCVGLCGVCDGDPSNDLTLPDGSWVEENQDSTVFMDSWQVPNTTSYVSFSRHRELNCSISDCSACYSMLDRAEFRACHSFVPPSTFCEVWVRDMEYVTNQCVALSAYVALCHKFNLCVEWRGAELCPFQCPGSLQYQACLPSCWSPSCPNQDFDSDVGACPGVTEGCVCPEGMLLHTPYSSLCIHPDKCACTDSSGVPRAHGEMWRSSEDSCCVYVCENDSIVPVENDCSHIPLPECHRAGEELLSLSDNTHCCPLKVCVCNQSICELPPPFCVYGEKLVSYYRPESCCPQHVCECDPDLCESDAPVCRDDQTLISTRADGSCCHAHICMCSPCLQAPPLCLDGQVLTVEANLTDHCCPTYTCECSCEKLSSPKCALGEAAQLDRASLSDSNNPCSCQRYKCVREAVCVLSDRAVLRPGQTLVEHGDDGVCVSRKCSLQPISGLHQLHTFSRNCTTHCQQNQIYVPPKDPSVCCGVCKNISCLYEHKNGSTAVYKPGRSWVSSCIRWFCVDSPSGPTLVSSSVSCPPFNESECLKVGGSVVAFLEGCCKTCAGFSMFPFPVSALTPTVNTNCQQGKEDGKSCQKVTVRMTIRKNDCRSNRPVNMVSCDGKCPSASIYNYNINSYARFCKCCREVELRRRSVQLYCSGNQTWVSYSIQEPSDCSCQWS
ncbi:otogelin isoform X1 [Gouania willdenowi]|uniref:otogelin isoform X1 n=1 Tax=Gouania willdenowi TaxID=441366 RepID=UPI00105698A7|nr:otogelin-like isoform X1 [Gouania willdenowi]